MANYILDFPQKNIFKQVSVSPMQIGTLAKQHVSEQFVAFGSICLIREDTQRQYMDEEKVLAVVMEQGIFVPEEPVNLNELEEVISKKSQDYE